MGRLPQLGSIAISMAQVVLPTPLMLLMILPFPSKPLSVYSENLLVQCVDQYIEMGD